MKDVANLAASQPDPVHKGALPRRAPTVPASPGGAVGDKFAVPNKHTADKRVRPGVGTKENHP